MTVHSVADKIRQSRDRHYDAWTFDAVLIAVVFVMAVLIWAAPLIWATLAAVAR